MLRLNKSHYRYRTSALPGISFYGQHRITGLEEGGRVIFSENVRSEWRMPRAVEGDNTCQANYV